MTAAVAAFRMSCFCISFRASPLSGVHFACFSCDFAEWGALEKDQEREIGSG